VVILTTETQRHREDSDFLIFGIHVFVRMRDAVVFRLQLFRDQQIIFGLEEICATVNRQFKIVAVSNGILRAGLDAITAEDAASIIDVINRRITFIDTSALRRWPWIVSSDDVNALRRTRRGAEITRNTLLAPELVDVQKVLTAITRLHRDGLVRIFDGPLAFGNVRQRNAHSLNDRFRRFDYFADD